MSTEMYAQLSRQIQILDYAEKLEMLTILTNALKAEHSRINGNSKIDKIAKITTFKGCMKNVWANDALEYQNSLREERKLAQ